MYRKYRELIKQINDGKNLETVLPQYAGELSGLLYEYSLLQSAMEFYSLKEIIDEEDQLEEDALLVVKNLVKWMEEVLKTGDNGSFRELHIKQIDAMRTEVTEKMNDLTMYADQLQIYEYVLNRMELEFEPGNEPISDERFAQRLYQYIFTTKDNIQINRRIQEVVAQLPIRIMKGKYFEYIKESFNCYKDADKSSIDTFIYMLRTSGMVYSAKDNKHKSTFFDDCINTLKDMDYTCLSKEEYEECCKVLKNAVSVISRHSNFYYQLEKVLNGLYVLLLLRPYVLNVNQKVNDNCINIITSTLEHMDSTITEELEVKLSNLFDQLLGIQEQHIEDYQYLSGGIAIIKDSLWELAEAIAIDTHIECLILADKLCGNSIFVDIHQEMESHKVTSDYLEYQLNHLVSDLTELFKTNPQCINRAVMAATLSKLPVFFNNSREVQQYIENSLSQCQNEAEKSVAKELLLTLMAEDE